MSNILVIDDDTELLGLMHLALEDAGQRATSAVDGLQGLSALVACRPDLVVTGMDMPEKEGVETLLEIKRLRPDPPQTDA